MDERAERVGENESLFREVDERTTEFADGSDTEFEFICECSQLGCLQYLRVPLAICERTRAHERRFLVADGHELPEFEQVVERGPGWLIVEKTGEARPAQRHLSAVFAVRSERSGGRRLIRMGATPHVSTTDSPLAGALRRCSETGEQTLERYRRQDSPPIRRFLSSLLLADAALETAARSIEADQPGRELSLMIAASLCREAAEEIRAHGLDEGLLRCAGAYERVAHLCERALASSSMHQAA